MNDTLIEETTTAPKNFDGHVTENAGLGQLVDLLNSPDLNDGATPVLEPIPAIPLQNPVADRQFRPVPSPAAARINFPARIYTTGRLKAGKDHVLKLLGYTVYGFADPLYALQEMFFGSPDKSLPGAREFLQKIGQWGRGTVSEKYPLTAERAVFATMIRTMGPAGFIDRKFAVDWKEFGKTDGVWVNALLSRLIGDATPRIGVSNVRFDNEQNALTSSGFTGFHVTCGSVTLAKRLKEVGLDPASPAVNDTSEQLAIKREANIRATLKAQPRGPKLRVIWSDEQVPCPSPRFITLDDIRNSL